LIAVVEADYLTAVDVESAVVVIETDFVLLSRVIYE